MSSHGELLQHFYEHLASDEWQEGLENFRQGRVTVETFQSGLLSAIVTHERGQETIHLKIHPAHSIIQWIECSCPVNRSQSRYCSHIAGVVLYLDRHLEKQFHIQLKPPPTSPPKKRKKPKIGTSSTQGVTPHENPITNGQPFHILDHLEDSIQSLSLIGQGPKVKVRVSLQKRQSTVYELSIDEAGRFLTTHPKLCVKTNGSIKTFRSVARVGTYISSSGDGELLLEKCIQIQVPSGFSQIKKAFGEWRESSIHGRKQSLGSRFFLFGKYAEKFTGEEFSFVPERGYFPLHRPPHEWFQKPATRKISGDTAAQALLSNFDSWSGIGAVWLDKDFEQPEIVEAPKISDIKVHRTEKGWFELDPIYQVGKSKISMANLLSAYKKTKGQYIQDGKTWTKVPDFLKEHDWGIKDDKIQVDTLGLLRLRAELGDFDSFSGSQKSLQQFRMQTDFRLNDTPPKLIDTSLDLRDYQHLGYQWLWWLYSNRLNGLLADDMGLGKTHQAMALLSSIQLENNSAKFLVICPTSVLEHWADKIRSFAPRLSPQSYHGSRRERLLQSKNSTTLITSYGIMLRDIRRLSAIQWDAIVLDEAHYVKNKSTATFKAVCQLNSKIRLGLTGTPMENHLGELKSLFDFLIPGYLGSDRYFRDEFQTPIEQHKDREAEQSLQRLIHPLKMRRTKKDVLKELPSKIEEVRHCRLSTEQSALYSEVLALKARPLIETLESGNTPVPYLHVFATLQMLKQVCNHPALLSSPEDFQKHESGKFELLKEIIDEALGSGNKIVIFTQYVRMAEIISSYCDLQSIGHVTLTGKSRSRGRLIQKFQEDPNTRIFIGSLLAGGIGIDLTAASVVIHYDRWWNASKENQATDRVHRIGQKNFVQVMKLVTLGTLEEKIDRMIQAKQSIFENVLEKDEDLFKALDRQQLIDLLQTSDEDPNLV
ncbi:MAG: SNF2-related protein [Oligoflexales bacterium]